MKNFHFRLVSYCHFIIFLSFFFIVFIILRALKMVMGGEEEDKKEDRKRKIEKTHFNVDENLLSSPTFTVDSFLSHNHRSLHHGCQGNSFLLCYYRFHPFFENFTKAHPLLPPFFYISHIQFVFLLCERSLP